MRPAFTDLILISLGPGLVAERDRREQPIAPMILVASLTMCVDSSSVIASAFLPTMLMKSLILVHET